MEGKIIVSEDPTPCVKYLNLETLITESQDWRMRPLLGAEGDATQPGLQINSW